MTNHSIIAHGSPRRAVDMQHSILNSESDLRISGLHLAFGDRNLGMQDLLRSMPNNSESKYPRRTLAIRPELVARL